MAASHFLRGCILGAGLGLLYGFLRPLRPRWTFLADSLFLMGAVAAWLELSFGVCGGDLRLGCTAGLLVGGFGTEWLLGWLFRPLFSGFWKLTAGFFRLITLPVKKFPILQKFCLHLLKNGLQ